MFVRPVMDGTTVIFQFTNTQEQHVLLYPNRLRVLDACFILYPFGLGMSVEMNSFMRCFSMVEKLVEILM